MNQINLEAEQVVSEEEEEAPKKKRSLFGNRKTVIIFAGVIVAEALLLFFLFESMNSEPTAAKEKGTGTSMVSIEGLTRQLEKAHKIEVGPISIVDERQSNSKADRHFSCTFEIFIEEETFLEIERIAASNPDAMNLVKRVIEREIRRWMLDVGGEALKDKEMQRKRDGKLRDYLNDRLPVMRNRIIDVFLTDFSVRRY